MTVPLSDTRLAQIRAAQRRRSNSGQWLSTEHSDVGTLLAEVDRLRAENEAAHRAEVLREAADQLDQVADDLEAEAIERDGHAYGRTNKTVAVWRDSAALVRRMAAPTTTKEQ